MPQTDKLLLKRARAMRSDMPQPERELWTALRAKRFSDVKFSRQVVIGRYIADFVARSRNLIIKVDGDTHSEPKRDEERTAWLESQGYRVVRFANADVISNIDGVLAAITEALATAPLPNPLPEGERA